MPGRRAAPAAAARPAASEAAVGSRPAARAAALLPLALLLLLLAIGPAPASAQASLAPASSTGDAQLSQLAATCPVSLRYEINLGTGQGSESPLVPIFVAVLTLQNNVNYTIDEWKMGWHFPYGAIIKTQQDVFDKELTLLTAGTEDPILESTGLNRSIQGDDQLLFSFLGTKGAGPTNASNPYNVGAISEVMFNNMRCTMLNGASSGAGLAGATLIGGNGTAPPPPAAPAGPATVPGQSVLDPTDLEVEYTPIQYVGQPLVSTFTQFLVRLRNIRNTSSAINMTGITMQYWFGAPLEGVPLFAERSPDQFFTVRCEWSSVGCNSVDLQVQPGYYLDVGESGFQATQGAEFVLNIHLNSAAGLLLPSGELAPPQFFLGQQGATSMDILVTITTKSGVALLNSTQDYSFLATPALTVPPNSTIVPHSVLPNPHITAFLNGSLAWGAEPALPLAPAAPAPMTEAEAAPGLPAGLACSATADGKGTTCELMAVYCCEAADGEGEGPTPYIPDQWPPAGVAPGTEAAVPLPFVPRSETSPAGGPSSQPNGTAAGPAASPGSSPAQAGSSGSPAPSSVAAAQPAGGGGGGSSGIIAGIAGGAAGLALLAAVLGFLLLRKRRRRRAQAEGSPKALLAEGQSSEDRGSEGGKGGTPRSANGDSELAVFGRHSGQKGVRQAELTAVLVPGGQQQQPLWGPVGAANAHSYGAFPASSEPGYSANSSPSKAGSLAPLLRTGGGPRSGLVKFGSGMSGVSSHDNPMFDESVAREGSWSQQSGQGPAGSTAQSVLPQHVASWEMQSQMVTQQAYAQAQHAAAVAAAAGAAGAAAAAAAARQQEEDDEGWRPDVLALLERKGATAPTLLVGDTRRTQAGRRWRRRGRSSRSSDGQGSEEGAGGSSSEESEDDGLGGGSSGQPLDWQLKRSKSWDGHLQETNSLSDSQPLFMRRRARAGPSQLVNGPPPLAVLPPPVMLSSEPAPDVDLNVDHDSEVKPFLGRCLGTGGFGAVYEATWRGKRVAVKKLPLFGPDQPCSESMYAALLREIELASKFTSDRLVKVYGACTSDREHVCLIMELMTGGNLFQRIYDRNKRRMGYLEILQLTHDVAAGLAYLHPSVVHRDLKPQNILLDCEGRAKLADFGISRVKDPTKSYLSQVTNDNGTPNYMAPEQFNGSRVDEKVDVYALGVLMNECYTRRQPWKDSSHFFQIILKVAINGERPWLDPDCPEPLRRLITKCWHQDPHMRPSCAEVMRLTAFMIQEEVHRWEQLQSGAPANVTRLPIAQRHGSTAANGSLPLPSSRRQSVDARIGGGSSPSEQQQQQGQGQGSKHGQQQAQTPQPATPPQSQQQA